MKIVQTKKLNVKLLYYDNEIFDGISGSPVIDVVIITKDTFSKVFLFKSHQIYKKHINITSTLYI